MEHSPVAWLALAVALVVFLWLDLRLFARGREPRFREAAIWSVGWVGVALAAAAFLWLADGRSPRPVVRRGGRPPPHDARLPLPGRDRLRRPRLRYRLDPGGVRDHPRRLPHLDGEHFRAARAASAVRARRRARTPFPLPRRDGGRRARVRGGQAPDRGLREDPAASESARRRGPVRGRDRRLASGRPRRSRGGGRARRARGSNPQRWWLRRRRRRR